MTARQHKLRKVAPWRDFSARRAPAPARSSPCDGGVGAPALGLAGAAMSCGKICEGATCDPAAFGGVGDDRSATDSSDAVAAVTGASVGRDVESGHRMCESVTALELWRSDVYSRRLSLGCPVLDACLGGGINQHGVTEVRTLCRARARVAALVAEAVPMTVVRGGCQIAGDSGAGKTQLCMQLLLQVSSVVVLCAAFHTGQHSPHSFTACAGTAACG